MIQRMRDPLIGPAVALSLALGTPCAAQAPRQATLPEQNGGSVSVADDGTVTVDGLTVPVSGLMSAEGAAYLRHLLVDKPFASPNGPADIRAQREFQDQIMRGFLEPMRKRYKVDVAEQRIAGIVTDVVTPSNGIAPENAHRVLVNLHGGGFSTGARTSSLVESVPLAALMRIKVISVDYRMSPEYSFPAASEDVAAVYRELLKTYSPSHIGIYGCSAGGILTAESIAWFPAHRLPNPAAIGVFCASLNTLSEGDSAITAGPLNGMKPFQPHRGEARPSFRMAYLANAKDEDPLAYPQQSKDVLRRFPPTLFITGTRSFEFSAALNSHNKLTAAGVESQFHGWDGMVHAFFYNSEMPESREAYAIMVRFFRSHLAK